MKLSAAGRRVAEHVESRIVVQVIESLTEIETGWRAIMAQYADATEYFRCLVLDDSDGVDAAVDAAVADAVARLIDIKVRGSIEPGVAIRGVAARAEAERLLL